MPDAEVTFVGTARGIEARVCRARASTLDLIRSGGLKGKSMPALVARRGAAAAQRARRVARHLAAAADVVIGVGGYSSGPVVALAALRGIPTLLLEQNAVPGLTNRLLAPLVTRRGGDLRGDAGVSSAARGSSPAIRCGRVLRASGDDEPAAAWRGAGAESLAALRARTRSTWPWWRQRRGWQPPRHDWRSRTRPESATWTWSATATGAPGSTRGSSRSSVDMDRRDEARPTSWSAAPARRRWRSWRRRAAVDSDSAADRDRRSPAQERRGRSSRQGRRS